MDERDQDWLVTMADAIDPTDGPRPTYGSRYVAAALRHWSSSPAVDSLLTASGCATALAASPIISADEKYSYLAIASLIDDRIAGDAS